MNSLSLLRAFALAGSCLALVSLAGCGDDGTDFDVSQQIGPDPVLPDPDPSLLPDLKVAEVVGWQEGETPTVPEELTVTAYAQDLANPRTVHTLSNGDILVVQSEGPTGRCPRLRFGPAQPERAELPSRDGRTVDRRQ